MTKKSRAWFGRKIAKLAALLKRMPEDRQRAFSRDPMEASDLMEGRCTATSKQSGQRRKRGLLRRIRRIK